MSSELGNVIIATWPKYIAYEKGDAKDSKIADYYNAKSGAVQDPDSFFYLKTGPDIFLMAMAIGVETGNFTALKNSANNIPKSALSDNAIWIMISVALAEEKSNLHTLQNGDEIVRICEEYANYGINKLITMDQAGGTVGDLQKKFEEKFLNLLELNE